MNEAAYLDQQALSATTDVYAFLRHGFGPRFMPEVHLSRTTNRSKDTFAFSAYRTQLWTLDLRVRWYPVVERDVVAPFLSAGLGIVIPENEFPVVITDPTVRRNTAALLFPVHAGASIRITREVSAELQAGWMFATTDDINPAHDGRFDGWLRGCVGLVYTLPAAVTLTDSDGDELPDSEERRIGTDPNRADTDVDGLSDGLEVLEYGTDPLNVDTDDGGVKDGMEVSRGTSPTDVADDILSIRKGENVALRNVMFETGQTTFPASSVIILRSLASLMDKEPTAEILILGHTDAVGDRDSNFVLSRLRAQGVRDWLLAQGIAGSRMTTNGLGPDNPASSNSSAEGRRRNRRIEIIRTR
ncbi:MAG: OmpA family protein [Candidatus Kapaibacterium sp.]